MFFLCCLIAFASFRPTSATISLPSWGFVDLLHHFDATSPLFINRSFCLPSSKLFFPSFVTALISSNSHLVNPFDEVGTFSADQVIRLETRPNLMARHYETEEYFSVSSFIWPEVDAFPVDLKPCSDDDNSTDLCLLEKIDERNIQFDTVPIFYSNDFQANSTRLVVSRDNMSDVEMLSKPTSIIGKAVCGSEECLPYFTYHETNQRCWVGCLPKNPAFRREVHRCPADSSPRPKCHLKIDETGFKIETSTKMKILKVSFTDFTPFSVTLNCTLPEPVLPRLCSTNENAICDPQIFVLRDGKPYYNSSFTEFNADPIVFQPAVDIWIENNGTFLNTMLSFTANMFYEMIEEASNMSGLYSFRIEYQDLMTFDPHVDGLPKILVESSTGSALSLSGLDFGGNVHDDQSKLDSSEGGCRNSVNGRLEYRGHVSHGHCNSAPCLPWIDNVPLILDQSTHDFPEQSSWGLARNYCRNPPALKKNFEGERLWCYVSPRSVPEHLSWTYCDVPLCPTAETKNLGFKRAGVDCTCQQPKYHMRTNNLVSCRDFCQSFTECQGFVIDDAAVNCTLLECKCDQPKCDPRLARTYYVRDDIPPGVSPYNDGKENVTLKIHYIQPDRPASIRCELVWSKQSFREGGDFKWLIYDPSTETFTPNFAANEVTNATLFEFNLKNPHSLDKRLLRCATSKDKHVEYHLIRVLNAPNCSVYFNQIRSDSYEISGGDFGFHLKLDPNANPRHFPMQWNIDCETSAPLGRCLVSNSARLCTPLVLIYQSRLQIGDNLKMYSSFDISTTVSNTSFHVAISFKKLTLSRPTENLLQREFSLIFYHPQLAKSHAFILNETKTTFSFTRLLLDQFPSVPLIPTRHADEALVSADDLAMACEVSFGSEKFKTTAKNLLRIKFEPPSTFSVNFICKIKKEDMGSFCFDQRRDLCYPVNLAVAKNGAIAVAGKWDNVTYFDSDVDLIPFDFDMKSPDRRTLLVTMTSRKYVVSVLDLAAREETYFGRYELGFYLDIGLFSEIFLPTGVAVEIEALPICRPFSVNNEGWTYAGSLQMSECGESACLPWNDEAIADHLTFFKWRWIEERPDLPYTFEPEEAASFCRSPTLESLFQAPVCYIAGDSSGIELKFCNVPFCNDFVFNNNTKFYPPRTGHCNCMPQFSWVEMPLPPPSNRIPQNLSAKSVVEFCQHHCLASDETCHGFNFDESERRCQLLSCSCPYNETSQNFDCSKPGVYYYQRAYSDFAEPFTDPPFAELRIQRIENGSSNVKFVCDLPINDVKWETDRQVASNSLEISGARYFEIKEVIKYDVHNDMLIKCSSENHSLTYMVKVMVPPLCHFGFQLENEEPYSSRVAAIGYAISFDKLLTSALDQPIDVEDPRYIFITLHCQIQPERFSPCSADDEDKNSTCSPYVRVFHEGNTIYRSYTDTSEGYTLTRSSFTSSAEQGFIRIFLGFGRVYDVKRSNMLIHFVPEQHLRFADTIYIGDDSNNNKIKPIVFSHADATTSFDLISMFLIVIFLIFV